MKVFLLCIITLPVAISSPSYVTCNSTVTKHMRPEFYCNQAVSIAESNAESNAEGNCSTSASHFCISGVKKAPDQYDSLGLCEEEEEDAVVQVSWDFNRDWIEKCDPSCKDFHYQRCASDTDCREGSCCSLPSQVTIAAEAAGGCGPPACSYCEDGSYCEDCSSMEYGTCIDVEEVDVRPGYSCMNDPPNDPSVSKDEGLEDATSFGVKDIKHSASQTLFYVCMVMLWAAM